MTTPADLIITLRQVKDSLTALSVTFPEIVRMPDYNEAYLKTMLAICECKILVESQGVGT